jgi:hypothetical protein
MNKFKSLTTSNTDPTEDVNLNQDNLPCNNIVEATCQRNLIITSLYVLNHDFIFVGKWPDLKELTIDASELCDNSWKVFHTFPNLDILQIESYARIPEFDFLSVFENGHNLKRLKIQVNSTEAIQKLAYCFPQLEELDLFDSHNISNSDLKIFSNFHNLKKLNSRCCSIEFFYPEASSSLVDLIELDNYELIKRQIKPRAIKALKENNCQNLAMAELFDSDSSSAIDEITPLSGSEQLESPSRVFVYSRFFKTSFPRDIPFDSFGSLERLTLSSFKLDDVMQGQLAGLVSLKELHLEYPIGNYDGMMVIL